MIKQWGIFLIKLLLIAGIFLFLFCRAAKNDALEQLRTIEISWNYIAGGLLFQFLATLLTIIRWRWLVRTLGISLAFKEALRIGFIGYIFNLSPVGLVGGDLIKSCMLARQSPKQVNEIAAAVIVDRVIGLYVMFLLGLTMIGVTGFYQNSLPEARFAVGAITVLSAVGTLGIACVLFPDSKHSLRRRTIRAIPAVGPILERVATAIQAYRNHIPVLIATSAMTVAVHSFFAMGVFCFAMALFGYAPSAIDHLVIYPVGNSGSLIPLAAGPYEYFLDTLYPLFPIAEHESYRSGYGMLIGLVVRLATIVIAGIGGIYYLGSRAEVNAAMKEQSN